MDSKKLNWSLVQCQYRNCLSSAALDAMGYTLLNAVLNEHPEWCDPKHYIELDEQMNLEDPPAGYSLVMKTWPAGIYSRISAHLTRGIERALKEIFEHFSGQLVAGTLRVDVKNNGYEGIKLSVMFVTAEKETE